MIYSDKGNKKSLVVNHIRVPLVKVSNKESEGSSDRSH